MDEPISAHHFTLRCIPQSDARQHILNAKYYIFPSDFTSQGQDHWGNGLLYGCCRKQHSCFEANVCGEVATGFSDNVPAGPVERERIFRYPTSLTDADSRMTEICSGLPGNDALSKASSVMAFLNQTFRYVPGTTTVNTTAAEAFSLGCGVCQDYAHIMLALLRAQGIPCRYVAGMLLGEGESHAWVEVLSGDAWYGFDPTNGGTVTERHIKLSHGRDAYDCAINRGIFRGIANQITDISVIVTEIE